MKFYPSDYRADPALRMCSIGARGLWMEMLCVMHEAVPRGFLLVNGKAVSERQLAGLAGVTTEETREFLLELEDAGVFSRGDDGTPFSRRMRRDDEKAGRDKANGKSGGNPKLTGVNPPDNPQPNPRVDEGDKAQIPESRSQERREESRATRDPIFEDAKALTAEVFEMVGFRDAGDILPGYCQTIDRIEMGLRSGWTASDVRTGVIRGLASHGKDPPPDQFGYFEKPIARAAAQRVAPVPIVAAQSGGSGYVQRESKSALAALDRLFPRDSEERDPPVIVRLPAGRIRGS